MFTRKVDFRWLFAPQWSACAVVLMGATVAFGQFGGLGGAPADANTADQRLYPNGLPRIEVMLKAALEHHPDVLAARSKLRAAEAEQRQAELKALKDVMEVRERWEKANRGVLELKAKGKNIDPIVIRDALTDQAAIEWELAFLLGTRSESHAGAKSAVEAAETAPEAPNVAPVAPVVLGSIIPRGQQLATMKEKLGKKITVEFEELPLKDAVADLSEKSGLKFILDSTALEDDGIPVDLPITCKLGEQELVTVLQALEDMQPLHFVVRDYGILVTTESKRSWQMISAQDFAKLTDPELREKLQQQRQEEFRRNHQMGGGMGGGGMF